MAMPPRPEPFQAHLPQSDLDDLRSRLARVRFPDEVAGNEDWRYGTQLAYLRELMDYWRTSFDWRAQEALLNTFSQFTVRLADVKLHFIHEQGKGPAPVPLLISHGWPGSVFEFMELIPMLTDPARFGGDPRDAFTVVAPSLPGYGFSFAPGQRRFALEDIAKTFATLMTDVLGYSRYFAQGGDWGSFVTSRLAFDQPDRVTAIHLNLLPVRRDPKLLENPDAVEQRYLDQLNHFIKEEMGYQWIQGTKPQTLAYALNDSPLGLAAWILEKFHRWSDCNGNPESIFTKDQMLADISLYWFTGTIGSSMWPYYARMHGSWPIPDQAQVTVPTGYAQFPREILSPPRSLASRMFANIIRWTEMKRGGHFAAMEQPAALAQEIRETFRPLR
jgi:microsomal epoxide hydrolase